MSTNCAIVAKLGGLYCGTACHWDGYEEGVGATLLAHYVDVEKIGACSDLESSPHCESVLDRLGNIHSIHQAAR